MSNTALLTILIASVLLISLVFLSIIFVGLRFLRRENNSILQEIIEIINTSLKYQKKTYLEVHHLNLQISTFRENLNTALQPFNNKYRQEVRCLSLGEEAKRTYKPRSVLFLHNSYYHFYYLAKALRRRGWDAITVSYDDPLSPTNSKFCHGEDVNLYSSDTFQFRQNLEIFFEEAKSRFELLHFSGDGLMSFFPEEWSEDFPDDWLWQKPRDIVEWRRLGKKVAYTISGCKSAVAQSTVAQWSAMDGNSSLCDVCPWQNRPEICCDERNLAWGRKVNTYCDLIFGEAYPALDYLDSPKTILNPVSMCLDSTVWHPELVVPKQFKLDRAEGEILIFHAMGNYQARTDSRGNNIKGTPFITAAIEQLQSEGLPVRLIFVTEMRNIDVRYVQVQADIMVDQLYAGRYGAAAREGMMLGKPVICYMNSYHQNPTRQASALKDCPLVSATPETIYQVLKELVLDKAKRQYLGNLSRSYALKWHDADRCAERYEQIYDYLMQGTPEKFNLQDSYSE